MWNKTAKQKFFIINGKVSLLQLYILNSLSWKLTEPRQEHVGLVDSRPRFSFDAPPDESLLVPLVGGKHVGAVMDTKDGHLLGVLKILQQLKTDTAGAKVQENE